MGLKSDSILAKHAVAESTKDLVLVMCTHCVENSIVPSSIAEGNSEILKALSRYDVRLMPRSIESISVCSSVLMRMVF